MRIGIFVAWCLLGALFCFPGCQASITASKLEAALTVDNPNVPTVTVVNQLPTSDQPPL